MQSARVWGSGTCMGVHGAPVPGGAARRFEPGTVRPVSAWRPAQAVGGSEVGSATASPTVRAQSAVGARALNGRAASSRSNRASSASN